MSKRITIALNDLAANYPRQEFTAANLESYVRNLIRFPDGAVEGAVASWLEDGGTYFPSGPELVARIPAEYRERAGRGRYGPPPGYPAYRLHRGDRSTTIGGFRAMEHAIAARDRGAVVEPINGAQPLPPALEKLGAGPAPRRIGARA